MATAQMKVSLDLFKSAFSKAWTEHITENPEYERKYSQSREWTQLMLGTGGIIGDILREIQDATGLALERRSWYTVDDIFIEQNEEDLPGYPSRVHVVIEHENGADVEVEMWKLMQWRAPLKVIIFYDWNERDKAVDRGNTNLRREWLQNKLRELSEMRRRAQEFHGEDDQTEYLFIIGNRDEQDSIRWRWASPRSDQLETLR